MMMRGRIRTERSGIGSRGAGGSF
ncbi:unnamed protein product [Linum tenue]|uniref:Uncharacterized protein n=1 Tax=Linum tenue TaxID=586396 RepID=A0AAV0NFM0_9ROSI|nr:unnamed protein product [Linum tenue]